MAKYTTLIFDLDDTLINNTESIRYAFQSVLNNLNIAYNENFFKEWLNFDAKYWEAWEKGQMVLPNSIHTKEERATYLRANRFVTFFNIDFNLAIAINNLYCDMLGVNIVEIFNAKKLLKDLKKEYLIVLATNGPKKAAQMKLEKAKLISYIDIFVYADDAGFPKPRKEFFNYLYAKISSKDRKRMLLIGDSLTSDIQGGMDNGIDTCWFNRKNINLPKEYLPTMTINNLLALKKKL